jgi:hypothetical protein
MTVTNYYDCTHHHVVAMTIILLCITGEETVDGEHTNTEGRDLLLGEASEGVNYDGINMRAKGGSPLS